jgi:hypothetical protein
VQPQPASSGAWFYSALSNEWRADHYAPQMNNFCACAGVNTSDACSLIFAQSGHMYIDFALEPDACCHLCDAKDGCGVLVPAWIAQPAAQGKAIFEGVYTDAANRQCSNWCIPGQAAAQDCWAFQEVGGAQQPCMYSENFAFPGGSIVHNLTFTSFVAQTPPRSAFAVRPACEKPCPKQFPVTCQ